MVVTKDRTIIYGGYGDPEELALRLHGIKAELEKEEDEKKIEFLSDRIALLSSKAAKIFVPGLHEEAEARKRQAEQIVTAVRCAAENGIVTGVASSGRMKDTDWYLLGAATRKALEMPARALLERNGINQSSVLNSLKEMS